MTIGAFICLGLIGAQLVAQIVQIVRACGRTSRARREAPHCPPISARARREYLDRKADIERDARRRL